MKEKLVKADYRGKEFEREVYDAAGEGKLRAFIKHPDTGEPILVPPHLVRKMRRGESVTLDDLLIPTV